MRKSLAAFLSAFVCCFGHEGLAEPIKMLGIPEISESLVTINTNKTPKKELCRALNLQSGDYNLVGVLHLPTTPMPKDGYPTVVLFHGFRGSKIGGVTGFYRKLAYSLACSGIATVRFDCPGCGDSEGVAEEVPIRQYLRSGEDILSFVCRIPEVNSHRLGLAGFSIGCHTAFYLSGLYNPRLYTLKAMTVWAPVADGAALVKDIYNSITVSSSQMEQLGKELGFGPPPLVVCKGDVEDLLSIQDYITINSLPVRVNILHLQGENDTLVTMLHQRLFYNMAPSNMTFKVYDRTGHNVYASPHADTIVSDMIQHFVANL